MAKVTIYFDEVENEIQVAVDDKIFFSEGAGDGGDQAPEYSAWRKIGRRVGDILTAEDFNSISYFRDDGITVQKCRGYRGRFIRNWCVFYRGFIERKQELSTRPELRQNRDLTVVALLLGTYK